MLKMVTWISLGMTILGAVVDLTHPDSSGGDAAEIALMAKLLLSNDDGAGSGQPDKATVGR